MIQAVNQQTIKIKANLSNAEAQKIILDLIEKGFSVAGYSRSNPQMWVIDAHKDTNSISGQITVTPQIYPHVGTYISTTGDNLQ